MRDGLDVSTLSLSLRSSGARLLDGFESLIQLRLELQTGGEGITPIAQCDTPVGDCTRGIVHKNGIECFNSVRKLKRVHQSHGAIEFRLSCFIAPDAEGHSAHMLRQTVILILTKPHPP